MHYELFVILLATKVVIYSEIISFLIKKAEISFAIKENRLNLAR